MRLLKSLLYQTLVVTRLVPTIYPKDGIENGLVFMLLHHLVGHFTRSGDGHGFPQIQEPQNFGSLAKMEIGIGRDHNIGMVKKMKVTFMSLKVEHGFFADLKRVKPLSMTTTYKDGVLFPRLGN